MRVLQPRVPRRVKSLSSSPVGYSSCPKWCSSEDSLWSKGCAEWTRCTDWSQCVQPPPSLSAPPPVPPPPSPLQPTPTPSCWNDKWGHENTPWSTKCTFVRCSDCAQCAFHLCPRCPRRRPRRRRRRHRVAHALAEALAHPGVLGVRGRPDFSRFDPCPERPHFSNFGPPAELRPFCENSPQGQKMGFCRHIVYNCRQFVGQKRGFEPCLADTGPGGQL